MRVAAWAPLGDPPRPRDYHFGGDAGLRKGDWSCFAFLDVCFMLIV